MLSGNLTRIIITTVLVTWPVTLVTLSYKVKNGGEALGQDTVGASWRQGS